MQFFFQLWEHFPSTFTHIMSIVMPFQIKNKKLDSIHCSTINTGTLNSLLKSRGHLSCKRTSAHKRRKKVTVSEAYTGLGLMGHMMGSRTHWPQMYRRFHFMGLWAHCCEGRLRERALQPLLIRYQLRGRFPSHINFSATWLCVQY